MENSKSLKRAVLVSVVSAAASVLVTFIGQRLLAKSAEHRRFALNEKNLNNALKDSMDCSDPVAKY